MFTETKLSEKNITTDFLYIERKINKSLPVSIKPNPLNLKATMWLYSAQNVVNIPVICSYTGELICPQMPQNEERNISTDSSSRIVHLQGVLPPNFTIFSSISMIMASIAQQWVFVPRIFAALDFPRKNRLTRI